MYARRPARGMRSTECTPTPTAPIYNMCAREGSDMEKEKLTTILILTKKNDYEKVFTHDDPRFARGCDAGES